MTLQLIELHQCCPSLVNSAEWIRKEQLESLGNGMLKVDAFDTIRELKTEMAAYAAVTSLMGTIHLITQSSGTVIKEHLKLIYEKVGSLLEFLDNSDNEPMKDLQKKVKTLANEVEDS